MEKIKTFLWFNGNAEEAANFYASVFKNFKMGQVARYTEGTPGEPGSVMTISFEINGQEFVGLNGGPDFKFSEAISFAIPCDDQQEVDYYWEKLSEGGEKSVCGWLKDKFGLSWQVVPTVLSRMLEKGTKEQATRVMQAVMQMKKLEISELEKAFAQPVVV